MLYRKAELPSVDLQICWYHEVWNFKKYFLTQRIYYRILDSNNQLITNFTSKFNLRWAYQNQKSGAKGFIYESRL